MIRKPLDLPPAVARAFVEDMRAYFDEENPIKRDGIAVRQLRALRAHQGSREKKLRLSDVKELFAQMKDHTTFAGPSRRVHWTLKLGLEVWDIGLCMQVQPMDENTRASSISPSNFPLIPAIRN